MSSSVQVNEKYNRLLVIDTFSKKTKDNDSSRIFATCKCDCGNTITTLGTYVKTGKTKSCGCLRNELSSKRWLSHGVERGLSSRYLNMITRCYNENNKAFPHYGGRGIKVCDEWKNNIHVFAEWALSNGYKEGLTLDRIDVNGNYCPENCRFVTVAEQNRNKRNTHSITAFGETKNISEWGRDERCKVGSAVVLKRIRDGFSPEKALSMPKMDKYKYQRELDLI